MLEKNVIIKILKILNQGFHRQGSAQDIYNESNINDEMLFDDFYELIERLKDFDYLLSR